MLFRKRAWDLMREDFAWVDESASLAEVVRVLRESQQATPQNNVVLVMTTVNGKPGVLKGAVSLWNVLQAVDECVLRDPDLKIAKESDFDKTFARASAACVHTALSGHMEPDVPTLRPGDPMPTVLDLFLRKRRGWAVVEENGKVLGVVLASDLYREITNDIVQAF
jgi:CBS domain-containing protein